MPWQKSDAVLSTKKAKSPKAKAQWQKVANSVLKRTGDDGLAKREANAVIARRKKK